MCWYGIIPEIYDEMGEAGSRTVCTVCYICPEKYTYISTCGDMYKHLTVVVTLGKKVGAGSWWLEGDLYVPLVLWAFCKSCTCFTHCKVRDCSIRLGLTGSGTLPFGDKVMLLFSLPKTVWSVEGKGPNSQVLYYLLNLLLLPLFIWN